MSACLFFLSVFLLSSGQAVICDRNRESQSLTTGRLSCSPSKYICESLGIQRTRRSVDTQTSKPIANTNYNH